MDHVAAAGTLVQIVDILSDQGELRNAPFHLGQSEVARIRLRRCDQSTPPVIPLPNQFRIVRKCFWRGQLLRAKLPPEAVVVAKSRYTALRRYARAR